MLWLSILIDKTWRNKGNIIYTDSYINFNELKENFIRYCLISVFIQTTSVSLLFLEKHNCVSNVDLFIHTMVSFSFFQRDFNSSEIFLSIIVFVTMLD